MVGPPLLHCIRQLAALIVSGFHFDFASVDVSIDFDVGGRRININYSLFTLAAGRADSTETGRENANDQPGRWFLLSSEHGSPF
jgi:hypothetical protein